MAQQVPSGAVVAAALVAGSAAAAAADAAVPQPKTATELEAVLSMMLQPDTQKIAAAEKILKKFMAKSNCVSAFMQQIVGSQHVEARQMAAVLLRECIWKHWRKLKPEAHAQVKTALMKRLLTEPHRLVRLALCGLVSAVARYLVPAAKWNELIAFLIECTKREEPQHKEVGLMLFRTLAEYVGEHLKPQFHMYEAFFIKCLKDTNERLRLEALKGVQIFVDYVTEKDEVKAFRDLIPPIVSVLQVSVAQDKTEAVTVAFEILEILAESDKAFLTAHIPVLIKFMLELSVNKRIDINIRQNASSTVCAIAKRQPGQLTKHKMVEGILKCALMLIVEPFKDVFDVTDMTPQKIGVELLDHVILSGVPKKNVYQICMKTAHDLLKSQNEHDRKGAFVILAVMAEGCADLLKEVLEPMIKTICGGIKDKSPVVRGAACVALSQFADHIQPEVTEHHQMVLPHLLLALSNADESAMVKKKCCLALEVFCEHLGVEIIPYIDPLMRKMGELLKSKDVLIQASVISAIKSTAIAAGPAYKPYYADTIKIMIHLMGQTADEMLGLRCKATETAGAIGIAVGKQVFAQNNVLITVMKQAVEGMKLDFFELRDSTYQFFESMAEMLGGKDFLPFLQTVMTFIFATLHSDDGVVVNEQNQDINPADRKGLLNSLDDGDTDEPDASPAGDGEEDDDDAVLERNVNFSIRSGALDEKTSALRTVCAIMEQVGAPFLVYMERLLTELDEISVYPHYYIRMSVVEVYHEILHLMLRIFPNPKKWAPGVAIPLHAHTKVVVDSMIPNLLTRLTKDTHKETVAKSLDALTDLMKYFGPAAVQGSMKDLVAALLDLINEKAQCQNLVDDEDEKDEKEFDEVIIDSVTDTVGMTAQICGPAFDPVFKQMLGPLLKLTAKARPEANRSMAIGCVAEVCNELGAHVKQYVPQLFPIVLGMCGDTSLLVKRNSAYCAGVLIENGAETAFPFYEKACIALAPYFDVKPPAAPAAAATAAASSAAVAAGSPDKKTAAAPASGAGASESDVEHFAALAARDNAASALAKMITLQPKALPLDKLLPLLWKACPLDVDFNECKSVYGCILNLFRVNPSAVSPHIPTVVTIFSQVLGKEQVAMEVRQLVLKFCVQIITQLGAQLQPTLNAWPAARKDAFMNFVKGVTPLPAEINDDNTPTHHKAKDADAHKSGTGLAGSMSMSSLSNKPTPASPAAAAPTAAGTAAAASPNAAPK